LRLAALVDTLEASQLSFYLIKNFNKYKDGPVCFYNSIARMPVKPNFAVMNSFYLPNYSGPVICSSLGSLKVALKTHTNHKIYLYLWDLEWLRKGGNFENYNDIRNENVTLISRSESHSHIIENFSNRKVSHILDDWNINQIKEIING
jgi:hypothetical protein